MSDVAIRVENLGKRYRIGALKERHDTLRDAITARVSAPARRLAALLHPSSSNGDGRQTADNGRQEAPFIWALRDVSFEVKRGEVVGIIGRNGAGKSTLLKILSRITKPTTGRVELYGRVGSLLEVGTGFHPELSGRENVYLNGAILGMRKAEIDRKLDEIVAFAEIEKFLDTPVKRYSSGMYVRLAFAVAAHLEPEILLVDEVLAVGDAAFQKKCLGKMGDVAREGRTVLFVSHNMAAIQRLCTRACFLEDGTLAQTGLTAEVVSSYLGQTVGLTKVVEWGNLRDSPGSSELKMVSISLTDDSGMPLSVVDVEQELKISLVFYVSVPNVRFRCALVFKTNGIVAFSLVEPTETLRTEIGYYYSQVTIPGNFLAEGEYSVSVSMFSSRGIKVHHVRESDVITFQVFDPMTGSSSRGDYAEAFAGVVRPKFKWHTARLESRIA